MKPIYLCLAPGSLVAIPALRESQHLRRQLDSSHPVAESELSPEDATLALLAATNRVMARLLPIQRKRQPLFEAGK